MAKPVTLARRIYHQTPGPIGIEVDPNLKDEIAMRKFWIMRMHLSKKSRVDTSLGTYLRGFRIWKYLTSE
jgi:hypothetical protein